MRRGHGRLAGLVLVGAAALALTCTASPAAAHPSDRAQILRLGSDGSEVHVRWMAAPDDLAEIARVLGLIQAPRTFVFDDGELVREESDESDVEILEKSSEVRTYLVDHIEVRQDGEVCAGTVTRVGHLDHDGARLRFECPADVTDVAVTVTTMTDIDPGYRTEARSSQGDRATYSAEQPTWTWRLADPQPRLGRSVWFVAGSVVLLAAALCLPLLARRRRVRVYSPRGAAPDQRHEQQRSRRYELTRSSRRR
jgi:hypothetical protein